MRHLLSRIPELCRFKANATFKANEDRLYDTLARPGDGGQNPVAAMMLVRRGLHIFCETVFCTAM